MKKTEKVPIRIQLWMGDTTVDVRGWLDDFTSNNEITEVPTYGISKQYAPTGHKDYSLKAHTDYWDQPWKFERGKPKVEA